MASRRQGTQWLHGPVTLLARFRGTLANISTVLGWKPHLWEEVSSKAELAASAL